MVRAAKRLIVVDDHPVLREGLRSLIEREPDLRVCAEATTVAEALEACNVTQPHGIIVDLSLGNESGLELIQLIRQRYRELPILVLSMHSEELYAQRVLRSGANGYVMKQEATSQLVHALRLVLAGRVFVSQAVADRMLRSMSLGTTAPATSGVERLSNRELEVFRLLGMGLGTAQIATHLHISQKTVETHRARIKEKLGIETAMELIVQAATWVNGASPPGQQG